MATFCDDSDSTSSEVLLPGEVEIGVENEGYEKTPTTKEFPVVPDAKSRTGSSFMVKQLNRTMGYRQGKYWIF